jgi:protein-tyrosine phosphatase
MDTASDSEQLDSLAITHIISLNNQISFPTKYEYLPINIDDAPNKDIYQYFDDTYEFIEQSQLSLTNGGGYSCLVHCAAGVSRSATIVLAYIMRKLRIPLSEALTWLKDDRPCVQPNLGFMFQLRAYQFKLGIPDSPTSVSNHNPEPVFTSENKQVTVYNSADILFLQSSETRRETPVTVYSRFPIPHDVFPNVHIVHVRGSFISVACDSVLSDAESMTYCVTEPYLACPIVYNLLRHSSSRIPSWTFDEIDQYLGEHYPDLQIVNKYTSLYIKRYYDGDLESLTHEKLCQIQQIASYLNPTNAIQLAGVLNTLERMDTFNLPEVLDARESLAERIRGYLDI